MRPDPHASSLLFAYLGAVSPGIYFLRIEDAVGSISEAARVVVLE